MHSLLRAARLICSTLSSNCDQGDSFFVPLTDFPDSPKILSEIAIYYYRSGQLNDFEKMKDTSLRDCMKKIWDEGLQKIDLTTVGQIIGVSVSDILSNTNTTFNGWD